MGRDGLHGRQADGRGIKKRTEKRAQVSVEAVILRSRSPSSKMKKQREVEQMKGQRRARKSAGSHRRRPLNRSVLHPYFTFAQIHSARGGRGKRMEKYESKSTEERATDRGNALGALVLFGARAIQFHLLYSLKNIFCEFLCYFRAFNIGNLDFGFVQLQVCDNSK